MESNPLVTLGIVCYNHEKYLSDCFKSVLKQDYQNLEVIINDDCSRDSSVSVIESYVLRLKERFINVKFIKNSRNQGVCKSVNNVIRNSKGKYIKLLASDDIMLPNCISALVGFMNVNKDKLICFSNGYIIDDKYRYGDRLGYRKINRDNFNLDRVDLFERLMRGNFINTVGVLIDRSIFQKYGLFDETLGYEDHEMWLRLSRYESFGYINQCLIGYRRAETSLTNINTKNGKRKLLFMLQSEKDVIKKYLKYIKKEKRKYYISAYYNRGLRGLLNYHYYYMSYLWLRTMIKKNISFERDIIEKIESLGFWKRLFL